MRVRAALIFDLDGTLVDSLPDLADALNKLLAEHGARMLPENAVRLMVGDGVAILVERGFREAAAWPEDAAARRDLVARFLELYEPHAADRSRPYPGVREMLVDLQKSGARLAICTNKPEIATRSLLGALDLDRFFPTIIGGDTTARRKPDPLPMQAALERMQARLDEAVMIGDSPNDVAAARAIGMPVVAVTFGYSRTPPAELGADALISGFAELPRALDRIAMAVGA